VASRVDRDFEIMFLSPLDTGHRGFGRVDQSDTSRVRVFFVVSIGGNILERISSYPASPLQRMVPWMERDAGLVVVVVVMVFEM